MKTSSRGELLEEWKMSQKRMEVMKSQYENKLQVRALGAVEMPQKRMEVRNRKSQYVNNLQVRASMRIS
jgi:hypothetical protein